MIIDVLILLLVLLIGGTVGWLASRSHYKPVVTAAERETARLEALLQQEKQEAAERLEQAKRDAQAQAQARLDDMHRYAQQSLREMDSHFATLAGQVLEAQKQKLEHDSHARLDLILKPLQDNLEQLDHLLRDSNEKRVAQATEFGEAIKHLAEQTASIGREADSLARALKGNSKTQGDWGEMILDNILEHSGLRRGEEYEVQESYKTDDQRDQRPDVVIHFPEGRRVIIDSKVSLTAFADYVNAETDVERAAALKRHLESVKHHVDELAAKDYPKTVKGAADYVIMFMPSEASYVAAVQADPNLNTYAWDRRVVIACPNILIMTLQIVNNIWKSSRQARNVEKIVDSANKLYREFVLFIDAYNKLGRDLATMQADYDLGRRRLTDGRGNLVTRFENMKNLGLNPSKQIDAKTLDEAGAD